MAGGAWVFSGLDSETMLVKVRPERRLPPSSSTWGVSAARAPAALSMGEGVEKLEIKLWFLGGVEFCGNCCWGVI